MTDTKIESLERPLAEWLAATDIGYLEISGPAGVLCLSNEAGRVSVVPPGTLPQAPWAEYTVQANTVGLFQRAHPLLGEPIAAPGAAVLAGQVVGLLRAGPLLMPVTAAEAGTVEAFCAGDGATVDYGAPLVTLSVDEGRELLVHPI